MGDTQIQMNKASSVKRRLALSIMTTSLLASGIAPAAAGDDAFWERLFKAYADEWGKPPASDPNAPPARWAAPFPPQPVTSPPYPFTDWPYGGASTIGATLPNSVGSPLMTALAPTDFGKWLNTNHIQIYGWLNAGFNVSSATQTKAGNFPAAYMYRPNMAQLDQAVLYVERLPNTVQKDHIDWGFRISALYGENYRYTTAYGFLSDQLQKRDAFYGFDMPMVYGEVYVPWVAQGMLIRFGRYISVPDIEAQLAPNNYMYSHSFTYGYDNYTNTGAVASFQLDKNWMVQFGLSVGTDSMPWNAGKTDPGIQPTGTACVRWTSNSANDNVYVCANGINNGLWGYNNLQWYGSTYYHKFNEKWHIALEAYHMHQRNVPDVNNGNATPFDSLVNGPFKAVCSGGKDYCMAETVALLGYLNYKIDDLNNLTWRAELFDDKNGQRTGIKTRYFNYAFGWQHWLSPSVIIRPEIARYEALDAAAFDGGTKRDVTIFSSDIIWKF